MVELTSGGNSGDEIFFSSGIFQVETSRCFHLNFSPEIIAFWRVKVEIGWYSNRHPVEFYWFSGGRILWDPLQSNQ